LSCAQAEEAAATTTAMQSDSFLTRSRTCVRVFAIVAIVVNYLPR
jgi:hypothetical protein